MQPEEILNQVRSLLENPAPGNTTGYAEKCIVVSPDDRQRIEKALGVNLSTSKELADRVERAMTVAVDGLTVQLSPYLLDRLKSRAIRVEWEPFIQKTVKRLLEEYVGIR